MEIDVPDIGLQFMTIDSFREKLEIIDFEKWTESEKERSLKGYLQKLERRTVAQKS